MKKIIYFVLLISLLIGSIGLNFASAGSSNGLKANEHKGKIKFAQQQQQQNKEIKIEMKAQNNSNENGTATIIEEGNQVRVKIELDQAPNYGQPAHIHTGSCPNPGDIVYSLNDVVNGKSETVVNVSLEDLMGQLPLAVNVHKSAEEDNVNVSCGDIKNQTNQINKPNKCYYQGDDFKVWKQTVGSSTLVMLKNQIEIDTATTSPDAIANQILTELKANREMIGESLNQQDREMYFDENEMMMDPSCVQDFFKIIIRTMDDTTVAKVMMRFMVNSTDNQTVENEIYNRIDSLTVEQIKSAMQNQQANPQQNPRPNQQ
ncbi:MAG: Cu-zn Superoxide dismutase [Parcubacteria group bacterium GW2011_GWE2_38_18]|nr:MAG: Cu-zn Superoxide dismutase [Parcubacteria group bacterium GW2011_GWE2_38_18]